MRCFIAIELPEYIKDFVEEIFDLRSSVDGVNFVKKENLHITLKFLGEISPDMIGKISQILSEISSEFAPFILRVSHPGVFPDRVNPRVIWIGLEFSEVLKNLAKKIDDRLNLLGFEREKREFRAHITLARIKNFRNGRYVFEKLIKSFMNRLSKTKNDVSDEVKYPQFVVEAIVLMKSTLTPKGSIYESLEKFPLSNRLNGIIKQNA